MFIHTGEKPGNKLNENAISINSSMSTYIIHSKRFIYLYNLFHICCKVILYLYKRTTIKETVWNLCNMNGIKESFCFQCERMHMFGRQLMNAACCTDFEMYHLCYFIISKSLRLSGRDILDIKYVSFSTINFVSNIIHCNGHLVKYITDEHKTKVHHARL